MKHSMMRAAVAATLGFAALAANAGQIGVAVGSTVAAEYLVSTAALKNPVISFTTSNLINSGATVTFHVRFSAGTVATVTPAPTNPVAFANYGTVTAPTAGAITVDADKLGFSFTVTASADGLPAGTIVNIAAGNVAITQLNTALGNGGSVSTSVGYTTTAGDYAGVSTWVEAPVSATILNAKKSISAVIVNSTDKTTTIGAGPATYFAAAESKKVDVAKKLQQFGSGSPTVNSPFVTLGALQIVADSTLVTPAGGTATTADFDVLTVTATGDFSGVVDNVNTPAVPGSVFLAATAACSAAITNGTAQLSTDNKTATFSGIAQTDYSNPMYLCYKASTASAIPFNVQFAVGGSTLAAGLKTLQTSLAGGNVYLLKSNGAAVFVPSFVPTTGAVGTGYNTYLRIVNTGNLTADISAAAYSQTAGTVGASSVVAPALKPGASVVVQTSDVPVTAAGWSSLLVTGSTSSLAVQPLLVNPQGVITNMSSYNN